MKKIFLFITILFVFSCGENNSTLNSSGNESSSSTTVSENTENSPSTKIKKEKLRIENVLTTGANYYLADMKKVTKDLDAIFLGGNTVDIDDFVASMNSMEKGLKKHLTNFRRQNVKKQEMLLSILNVLIY